MFSDGERDFQGRDVAEVKERTEAGGRMCGGLAVVFGVANEVVFQKVVEAFERGRSAASCPGRRRKGSEWGIPLVLQRFHFDRMQVFVEKAVDLRTDRVRRILLIRDARHRND